MGLLNRAVILNFLFPEESPLSDSKSDPNARAIHDHGARQNESGARRRFAPALLAL